MQSSLISTYSVYKPHLSAFGAIVRERLKMATEDGYTKEDCIRMATSNLKSAQMIAEAQATDSPSPYARACTIGYYIDRLVIARAWRLTAAS